MSNSPVYKRPDFNNINFIMDKPFLMPRHLIRKIKGTFNSLNVLIDHARSTCIVFFLSFISNFFNAVLLLILL